MSAAAGRHRGGPIGRAPRAQRALVVAGAALALAALLPGDLHGRRHAHPAGGRARAAERVVPGMLGGVPLQRASCAQWQGAGPRQRRAAVRALRATVGGASSTGGVGTTLTDDRGMATLDRICATPSTGAFVLYVLYARAAAFSRVAVGV